MSPPHLECNATPPWLRVASDRGCPDSLQLQVSKGCCLESGGLGVRGLGIFSCRSRPSTDGPEVNPESHLSPLYNWAVLHVWGGGQGGKGAALVLRSALSVKPQSLDGLEAGVSGPQPGSGHNSWTEFQETRIRH